MIILEGLIIGFTCPPTIHFKFITKGESFVTIVTAYFITKCNQCYYKVRQFLQCDNFIIKCDDCYKVRQFLTIFFVCFDCVYY